METVTDFIFLCSKITVDGDCSHEIKRCFLLGRKAMTNLDSILKTHCFTNKGLSSQSYGFSSSHVWMWELDGEESWALKNWCFWTVVLEKTLESPLDSKEIQPVHPKGNQPWIFIGRTDTEAPILWPPDAKSWLTGKDPDAGKDWRQGEKGMTENEMVGWHHQLDGHEFEQAPGGGDGQGGLVCCSPCGHKQSDTNKLLNWLTKWRAIGTKSTPIGMKAFSPTLWGHLMTINHLCQQKAVFKFSWKKAKWGLIWFGAFLVSEAKAQSLRKREGVGLWA